MQMKKKRQNGLSPAKASSETPLRLPPKRSCPTQATLQRFFVFFFSPEFLSLTQCPDAELPFKIHPSNPRGSQTPLLPGPCRDEVLARSAAQVSEAVVGGFP